MPQLPLNNLLVVEFGQHLSAPLAGLRLADMGAQVIKIQIFPKDRFSSHPPLADEQDFVHHQSVNRNKDGFGVNLHDEKERFALHQLLSKAQVLLHNYPEAYMGEWNLDYAAVKSLNPAIIYGCISGYGSNGPWKSLPGLDALLQAVSGLPYTTGNHADHPTPFGAAVADKLCSAQLVQGILAALIRRHKTGQGALVEVSLLESLIDFQFELLTTYHSSGQVPQRSTINNGHPLLSAPYGIYATADGFIAIAMVDLQKLASAIECRLLLPFTAKEAFAQRDEIKTILSDHLKTRRSAYWLEKMQARDLWTMEVLSWKQLTRHPAYTCLEMEQLIHVQDGTMTTTRCPIRFGGQKLFSSKPAPAVAQPLTAFTGSFNAFSLYEH